MKFGISPSSFIFSLSGHFEVQCYLILCISVLPGFTRGQNLTQPGRIFFFFCFNSKQRTFNLNCLLRIKIKPGSDALRAVFFWPPSWKVLDWNDYFVSVSGKGLNCFESSRDVDQQRLPSVEASPESRAKSASGNEIQAEKNTGRHIYREAQDRSTG